MKIELRNASDADLAAWKNAVEHGVARSINYDRMDPQGALTIAVDLVDEIGARDVPPELRRLWEKHMDKAIAAEIERNPLHRLVSIQDAADAMHAWMLKRIEALMGCTEGSPEEAELRELADIVGAYESKRWPIGKPEGSQ